MTVDTLSRPVQDTAAHPLPATAAHPLPETGRLRRPRPGQIVRAILVAVAVVLLVRFARYGWPEVRASLALITAEQAPLLAAAIVAETLWVLAMSQVYRSALMAFGGAVGRAQVLRISMAAFTLSRLLPGGGAAGGAVAARELIAAGNPGLRTALSLLSSWWITMTGLAAMLVAGVGWSVAAGRLGGGYLVAPGIALAGFVAGGAAIVLAARSPRLRVRLGEAVARAAERMGPSVAAGARSERLESIGGDVRLTGVLAVFGWGMAVWVLDAAALWFSLAAFGWHADIGVLLVGYGVANLISALPELTPGWLGVIEASVAASLAALGVPLGTAVVAVLAYRLVSYWLPTAAGVPFALSVVGRLPRRRRPAVRTEGAWS